MKKLIALFAVVLMTAVAATTADAGRFGIKGGVNVTNLDVEHMETIGALGYSAGLTWQWDLPLGFALQPEILYHVNATKFEQIEQQLSQGSIRVPINVQWGLRFADRNVRVFAQASPFVGYVVNSNLTSTSGSSSNISSMIPDQYKDYYNQLVGVSEAKNNLTYGAGLGVGIQLWALQLTAQYNWNFGSIANLEGATFEDIKADFNDSNFGGYTVTLAIMFGGKKK